ncbi:hypothetical protein D2E25_1650 [Bifidobacterium goeldii]|uniref:Uncharacterized protein n=1 Tax=Bifidobacterium goeldii TaxID=2306975 RepID=A0A430FHD5_9BIFI|nr:hypothetical protein [Bifidobacterium goeldii]RSX52237.1 hypothetical protein D2E25_1650 [Bifidobacterium goeldii]
MVSTLDHAEALRQANEPGGHITLTDLNRSNAWRSQLADNGIVEVMDRNDTAAYLLTPQALYDLVDAVRERDAEIETMSVRAMFEARKHRTDVKTGSELREAAQESLARRLTMLHEVLDDAEDGE